MPQGPIAVQVVEYPAPQSSLDITADTVVKASPGKLRSVTVLVAGSAPGSLNDVATDAPTVANQFYTVPNAVGTYDVNWPCEVGILVVPGTGQTLAVSYQ